MNAHDATRLQEGRFPALLLVSYIPLEGSPETLLLLLNVMRRIAAFIDLGTAVKMGLRKRKGNSKKFCGAYHERLDTHEHTT